MVRQIEPTPQADHSSGCSPRQRGEKVSTRGEAPFDIGMCDRLA